MFWDNFYLLCTKNGISPNALAKQLGIPSGSITAWSKGSVPRNNTLKKIAEHFDVSVDWLLGKTDEKEKPTTSAGDGLSIEKRMLIDMVNDLTDEDALRLLRVMRAILADA